MMNETVQYDVEDGTDVESSSSQHLLEVSVGKEQEIGSRDEIDELETSVKAVLLDPAPRHSSISLFLAGITGVILGVILTAGGGKGNVASPTLTDASSFDTQAFVNSQPSDYLLEVARNRSRDYGTIIDPKYNQLVTEFPAFDSMAPNFEPEEEWKDTHFPDINILGLPKAGSSQLYNILTSHPRFRKFHWHSEFCFNLEDEDINELVYPALGQADLPALEKQKIQQKLKIANNPILHSNKAMHKQWENLNFEEREGVVTVNKCVSPQKYWLQRQYLGKDSKQTPKPKRGKTILLLRDPAEWLWSAWNFWRQQPFEDVLPAYQNNWAKAPYQYRSPELFHEYMMAGERLESSQHLLQAFRDNYVAMAHRILSDNFVNNDDFLVLKSEDILPDRIESSGFLDKLASFLGVAKVNFNTAVLHSYSNCGNHKGQENHDCGGDDDEEGTTQRSMAYDIAGGRAMLNETRNLVYLHFAEECQLWKEKFGIEYGACLDVREKYLVD